ncbi:coiled-coil domain-containing protein 137 [Heptranchias perlo]|uniref:coiled-coil domain-containing protein 137 n=1 Tax=Heptranchias perlo TaxID=212740 RepID=UPI0035597048
MGKHRKIKAVDPYYAGPRKKKQQQQGDSEPKHNMKPKNIDDQEIPYKVREIMRSKEKMKKQMNKQKRKAAKPEKKPASVTSDLHRDIPVPKFKRRKWESEKAYIQRMEEETKHVMFMTKNQLHRCPEMENEEEEKESSVKSKSERKKEFDKKRLGRLIRKKVERKEVKLEKEMFTDTVRFGEVVKQPPTLTAKPRKSQATDRPGQRQLLLKSLIEQSNCASKRSREAFQGIKLSTMSMARQRMMMEERERVIKAYRALKKQKQQTLSQNKNSTEKLKNPK